MRVDVYTKVVLSIIAGTLLLLAAREFQNPPAVSAQQPHVQHVIIDDLAPQFRALGLPVSSSILAPEHVIIDNLDPGLLVRGIPVSLTPVNSFPQTGSWQYSVADCSANTLNSQGRLGWELISLWMSPAHAFTFDTRSGRGVISGLIAEEKNNSGPSQSAVCYFKKRTGV